LYTKKFLKFFKGSSMKFTTLKVAALTAALLGMSQFAVAVGEGGWSSPNWQGIQTRENEGLPQTVNGGPSRQTEAGTTTTILPQGINRGSRSLVGSQNVARALPVSTLSVEQATREIKGEEGSARSDQQVIAKAVELFQQGKISEATAMAALVGVLGADSAEIGNAFSALVAAGGSESKVRDAAISAGVDPTKVTTASAAAAVVPWR
jgi:hypothetical protein